MEGSGRSGILSKVKHKQNRSERSTISDVDGPSQSKLSELSDEP